MTFDYRSARESIFGSNLPGPLRLVALVLLEHMPNCHPSVTTIAKKSGVERKTAIRAIARLERLGVISVDRRNGALNAYTLQPVPLWRTGTKESPVPDRHGTGTNGGMGPVPNEDGTGTNGVPKAGRSRSESGLKREPRASTGTNVGLVFDPEPERPTYRRIPKPWRPDDALYAEALNAGVLKATLDEDIDYWRSRDLGADVHDFEGFFRAHFPRLKRRQDTESFKAPKRHGSAQEDHGIDPFAKFEETQPCR